MDLTQYMQKLHDLCEKGQDKMKPLRKWLDEQGIKWTDKSEFDIVRTHFYINGKHWSVIFGAYSYGAEQGLLELWTQNVNGGEPLGFLTVDDITELIKDAIESYFPQIIDAAPTIDAQPVVRCKECAFVDTLDCPMNFIDKQRQIYTNRAPDWFCADGRAKDELCKT